MSTTTYIVNDQVHDDFGHKIARGLVYNFNVRIN